ncbi:class I SAM-dependent methyltransferase [Aquibacillus salsiterrae]|uniref:Methyltransferase domain-containing protein n=1 Tax=Aquibacillus salsiterrae TaxID=2950439 RepID=A0A9X3WH68_9BACI|nr:class I SAM-dependent methyltransferase [Aquibacillus salsiterrae]MDC3416956.1 methyltransferase domain-containing protein [Aquibacillus salsiterrae]
MSITYTQLLARLGINGAHPGSLAMTKKMLAGITIRPTTKIVDVGCGTGQTVAYLVQTYPCHVTGLDCNQSMVDKAKKRMIAHNLSANILLGEAENLPFDDQSQDILLSESVTSFTNIDETLSEYSRVLKPNGLLIMNEMTNSGHLQQAEKDELINYYEVTAILTRTQWQQKLSDHHFLINYQEKVNPHMGSPIDLTSKALLDESLVKKLTEHYYLTEKYANRLSSTLFICTKQGGPLNDHHPNK